MPRRENRAVVPAGVMLSNSLATAQDGSYVSNLVELTAARLHRGEARVEALVLATEASLVDLTVEVHARQPTEYGSDEAGDRNDE
jgi:hypothetical protein